MRKRKAILLSLAALAAAECVWAYSIWDRPTDDFVCDLSPWTSTRLVQRTNIPAGVPDEEQLYARLALRTTAQHCKDGQLLILHSPFGTELESRYFRLVANHLCLAADVKQKPVPSKQLPDAFELRCRISKMAQARAFITAAESAESTEALILEAYRRFKVEGTGGAVAEPADGSSLRMCPGQVIGVGGICDR